MTAQEFLERENIDDSDFMDSGMTNTIAALMDKYHEEKVRSITDEQVIGQFQVDSFRPIGDFYNSHNIAKRIGVNWFKETLLK